MGRIKRVLQVPVLILATIVLWPLGMALRFLFWLFEVDGETQ